MAKLTNKFIDSLEMKKQSYIVWDNEVKGLGIRVNELYVQGRISVYEYCKERENIQKEDSQFRHLFRY